MNTFEIGIRIQGIFQESIINNMRDLLPLGQPTLKKYGKISIDYTNNVMNFE